MTRSRNIRLYRACQRCRQRKLKCDPTASPGGTKSSCLQCARAGNECVLAGSRRGGNFSRLRRSQQESSTLVRRIDASHDPESQAGHERKRPDDPIYAELTNPGDALQILAQLAANDLQCPNPPSVAERSNAKRGHYETEPPNDGMLNFMQLPKTQPALSDMETFVIGILGTDTVYRLLHLYATNHHTFCPLVPKAILATADLRKLAVNEPFLLAVILTIASKDEAAYQDIHRQCWQNLKQHLLDILMAAPSTLNVGSVEGLLLLAEWVPYMHIETSCCPGPLPGSVSAVEDNMAWSLIGQAVRHSYLLHLDKASFRETALGESQDLQNRKRMAWIFVYIADRQISVRMGQSFWSRGPSLSTRFTAKDFPSLCLSSDSQHNYASVLEATIELTQLLHNVHDVLYSSKERRLQMVRRGDYNCYLDDFRCSLSSWQTRWDDLETSPKLNCTLRIVMEYVRLYANAFSFQSLLSRAVHDNRTVGETTPGSTAEPKHPLSMFPRGIMSTAEGAYILEAVDASRNILTIAGQTNPESHIRYMPFRFYVYAVYSAVFLYKANVFGALAHAEKIEIATLVQQFIRVLEGAATDVFHIASRFASLLKRMWRSDKKLPSLLRKTSSDVLSQVNNLPARCAHPWNTNLVENQIRHDGAFEMRVPELMDVPTPDFDIFCPELSSLESELVGLGMGASDFPTQGEMYSRIFMDLE